MRKGCVLLLLVACGGSGATTGAGDATPAIPEPADAGPAPTADADASADAAKPACVGKVGVAGTFDRTIDVAGTSRRLLLHVPQSYRPGAAPPIDRAPLLLALHGYTEGPEDMRDKTHFDEIAEARGWIVAYPEGTSSSWNAGACCGGARFTGVDDVGFARALITAIEGEWCVDPKRVHVAGFSNGGFMAHRLACELSDVVASIGVVAGEVGIPVCTPTRAVPVAQAHGTLDPLVPYGGNPVLGYPSTMETMNGWAARDGCSMSPVPLATVGDATCVRWPGCTKGADVQLCTVANGVHDWFGGGTDWTDAGPPAGFVATTFIADFLDKHPMP